MSLRRKEAIEQLGLLRMSKGREFQIVGAATEKLLEPKQVGIRFALVHVAFVRDLFLSNPYTSKHCIT